MAKPGGSPENLRPLSELSTEELQKATSRGGIKSGEVRREKKRMSEIYAAVLAKKFNVRDEHGKEIEITGSDMIGEVIQTIIQRQDSASVSMIKELREGIDGSKLEHSGAIDMTTMDDKEYQRRKEEWLRTNFGLLKDGT